MKKDFLICIDSDGCVFDTMEIKHKECFCPAYIQHFGLQPVARYAREAWEFANLYSAWRGVNRFPVLLKSLELLAEHPKALARGFVPPQLPSLRQYVASGQPLNDKGIETWLQTHPEDTELQKVLAWSRDVNRRVGELVHGVPPFPHVRRWLTALVEVADVVIVSATQTLALEREWSENGLLSLVTAVKGQEAGTKKQVLARLKQDYPAGHGLMLGDAPGDREAAQAAGMLFYPICPEEEAQSWESFGQALQQFLVGSYRQEAPVERFLSLLPTVPPWGKRD